MTAAIRDAVILAAPDDAQCRIAGVPLLLRTILVLQHEGVERCTVVGAVPVPSDARIRCAVRAQSAVEAAEDDALHVVVGEGAVIDEALVRDLKRRARPGVALALESDGARIRVVPGTRLLDPDVPADRLRTGTLALATASRRAVERALLRGLETSRDGYLDYLIHRPLSRVLTRLFLRTRLTPNVVTALGVVLGVTGGLALGSPGIGGVLAGVGALLLSGVFDCCDGEIARIRFRESRIGHALDVTGDTLVHAALLTGIALHLSQSSGIPSPSALALLATGVLGAFAAITWSERTEARRHRVARWENRILDGVLGPLTTRDWYVFPVAFALAGRLDLLVAVAVWGAQLFWIAFAVLVWRVLRRG